MRRLILCFAVGCAGCAASPSPPAEAPIPPSPRACEEAYEDIARYYDADPERRRPAGLKSHDFLHTCRELPPGGSQLAPAPLLLLPRVGVEDVELVRGPRQASLLEDL